MSTAQLLVTLAGLAAIGWVNWYFFFARPAPRAAMATASGHQEIAVEVAGGYEPSTIRVRAGRPVRLVFHRTDTDSCTEEVVFGDFGIRRFLPAHQRTAVEFTPPEPGTYEFTCGMGMIRGRLIAD
ncbi:MAG: cupredoxin domain-containing protein [Gemmatimonadota bacterium]